MAFYESQLYLLLTWLYALWQWIRSNKIIICLIRLITGLLSQRFAGGKACIRSGANVYKILPGLNSSRNLDDDVLPMCPDERGDPDGTFVFGHRRHVIAGEQFLELHGGRQLLLTEHSMLCSIKRQERCEFVIEHMPVIGKFNTARLINNEDAIVLLANGHCAVRCHSAETLITSSYSEAHKSHLNFSMLATLPLVLQVKGYNFAAAFVSLAILGVDLFRTPMSKAFAIISDFVLIWVKLNVLRSWSQGYAILSIFSNSWLYSDQNAKCVYKSKGPFFCIYGSLFNRDAGFTLYEHEDEEMENMFKIEGERAQWLATSSDFNLGRPFLFHNEILVA